MRISWTTPALQDFAAAGEYLVERNPRVAARLEKLVMERINMLVDFPNIGRPGRVTGTRELVIDGTPYIVTYQVLSDSIAIVAFLHGRQQWPDAF